MSSSCTTAEPVSSITITPGAWRETRWVGSIAGHATSPDLLAGSFIVPDHQHAITRTYAAACADLAQATLGGAAPRTANWNRWFDGLRSAARELSPARGNQQVVQRALFHGARLEGGDASWARQLRRGLSALLAASLPEPVPALIGEDLDIFRRIDAAWLARQSVGHSDGIDACASSAEVTHWPTAGLRPNPLNPRSQLDAAGIDELAASIVAHLAQGGILQPLLITPDGIVVAGHRRLAAARRVGLAQVPVVIRSLSPLEQLEVQLTENIQRSDLTPVEEARAYAQLLEAGATQSSIARAIGVPASRVRERLALLDLDARIQERVHRGELPMRVALLLVPLRARARQQHLASLAVRQRLTVAQIRRLVEDTLALPPPVPTASLPADAEPSGGGLSPTRLEALEALRAEPERTITFGQLAGLAAFECGACGLGSMPTVCAECPNLRLLRAVLRHQPVHAA